jgi:2-oxo-4-hydroxy-4-carboxy-5-ureidoimidazoline decarboxylase
LNLEEFNQLSLESAQRELLLCCGSKRWAEQMAARRPYRTFEALSGAADEVWFSLSKSDWLEAFSHHPRIGERQLREKFSATAQWAQQEQKGTSGASENVLQALAAGNEEYQKRFGFVFLICATGKSAEEMLLSLDQRLGNGPERELKTAAGEQSKITQIRLKKWLGISG